MSNSIDNRIVRMQFENGQFENGVRTSVSSLEKLKRALKLDDSAKSLNNLEKSAGRCSNMAGLAGSVEAISSRFSTLGIIGTTALQNITNSAVNCGKRMVSALTIDPVKSGFQEYETQINAVQTILANTSSKGTTLKQVNAALDELNHYADKTIYNFTEMTRNIGTFTAAGVDLKTSVSAIQGIANLAAVSGSTSQQASTAMYQLSQALAAGTVKLMDWNSVVNAGMGGEVFQNALKETAKLHGVAIDQMIEKEGSFRETLSSGWLTSDILTETLSKFTTSGVNEYLAEHSDLTKANIEQMREQATESENTTAAFKEMAETIANSSDLTSDQVYELLNMSQTAEDAATKVKTFSQLMDTLGEALQSGWTQTWELLLGDFEEAKALFTELSDLFGGMIQESADARNNLLAGGLMSGWDQLLNKGIMDAEGYKEAVLNVAKDHGVAVDEMVNDSKAFQNALKDGTITSEMLTDGLSKFTEKIGAMSEAELEARGYTKAQVDELKELNESFKNGSLSMDEFVEKMGRPSGRENLIQSFRNSLDGMLSVLGPIKDAFRDIFPAMTSEQLYDLTVRIRDFTEKLTLSSETSENLKSTFKGLFAILDIGKQALSAVLSAISGVISYFAPAAGGLLRLTGGIGDFLVSVDEALKKSNAFNTIFTTLGNVLRPIADFIKNVAKGISDAMQAISTGSMDRLTERFSGFGKVTESASAGLQVIAGAFAKFGASLSMAGAKIISALSAVIDKISSFNFSAVFDMINTGLFAGILLSVNKFVKSFHDITDNAGGMLEGLKSVLDGVGDIFNAWTKSIQAGTLMKIAIAIGILAVALVAISLVDSEKLSGALAGISVLFAELFGFMLGMEKVTTGRGILAVSKIAFAMLGLAVAIAILSGAIVKIGQLDLDGVTSGLIGIAGAAVVLVAASKLMTSSSAGLTKGSLGLIAFAAAIAILADSVERLGQMDLKQLGTGLLGIGVLCAELVAFLRLSNMGGISIRGGLGIIALAAAIKVLASAVKDFSALDSDQLLHGLVGVGAVLAELSIFTNTTANASHVIATGAGLVVLGASMLIFAEAIKRMGSLSLEEIGRGLLAMAGSLTAVTLALNFMPKNVISVGIGLLAIAEALVILSDALSAMGKMTWEQVATGLVALGGSMTILAVAVNAMRTALPGAAAIFVISTALAILTPQLMKLSTLSLPQLGIALVALAGAFAIFGVAAVALTPVAPIMLTLAASMALFGVAIAAIGGGILALSIGLTGLAASGAAGAAALVSIIDTVISAIPELLTHVAQGIIAFASTIAEGAPTIMAAVKAIILSLVDVLTECTPVIVNGALELVISVMEALNAHGPQIADLLFQFIINMLNSLSGHMPELIQSIVDVFSGVFTGVIDAMQGLDVDFLLKGVAGIGIIGAMMRALGSIVAYIPGAIAGVGGIGIVIAEISLILAALGALQQIPGLSWLMEEGAQLLGNIGNAIGSFIGGIVGGVAAGVTAQFPQIGTDLANFMTNLQPFVDGAKAIDPSVSEGIQSLATAVLALTGANLLDSITSWLTGDSSFDEFGMQLESFGKAIAKYAESVAGLDTASIAQSVEAATQLTTLAETIPNDGGLIDVFTGSNSFDTFGTQLSAFGDGLSSYAESVAGLNVSEIAKSVEAATQLSDMATTIQNSGGLLSLFVGDNGLDDFGKQLATFGTALSSYSESIGQIDLGRFNSTTSALNSLVVFHDGLTDDNSKLTNFGSALYSFGQQFKNAYTQISGINTEKFSAVGTALKELSTAANGIDTAKFASLGASLKNMSSAVSSMGSTNVKGISSFKKALNELGKTNITEFATSFSKAKTTLSKSVNEMFEGLVTSVNSKRGPTNTAFTTVLNSCVTAIKSKYSAFYNAGVHVANGFVNGIRSKVSAAASAASAMASAASTAANAVLKINSPSKVFVGIGSSVVEGFTKGIDDNARYATKSSQNLGKAVITASKNILAINSPSKEFIYLGEMIGEGMAIGIDNSIVPAAQAASGMMNEIIAASKKKYRDFKAWLDERKYYGEISLTEELQALESAKKRSKKTADERIENEHEIFRVQNEIVDAVYQKKMDYIEKEKYYGRLALKDELAIYEEMLPIFAQSAKYSEEIERNIHRVKQEIEDADYQHSLDWIQQEKDWDRLDLKKEIEANERILNKHLDNAEIRRKTELELYKLNKDLEEATYQHSLNWIENEEFYGRMNLASKLAAWTRVLNHDEVQKDEKRLADTKRKIHEVQKSIWESQKQYYADIEKVQEDAAKKRVDLEKEYADKVKEINERLEQDIKSANDEYLNALDSRTSALYKAYGLFDEVAFKDEVDPTTLMDNLKDQVNEFTEWEDVLHSLSWRGVSDELIAELEEMGPSAIAEIKALNTMSDAELRKYTDLWSTKHALARQQATDELEGLRIETQNKIAELRANADKELTEYRAVWQQQMNTLEEETAAELEQIEKEFKEKVGLIKVNTEEQMAEMAIVSQTILREAGWDQTGQQIVNGIIAGIEKTKPALIKTIDNLANESSIRLANDWVIASPSKVFTRLGEFAGMGLVVGLQSYVGKSGDAGAELGNSTTKGLSEAISKVADVVNSDLDLQPEIRPVLDLSEVRAGAKQLNGIGLANSMKLAASVSGNMSAHSKWNAGASDLRPLQKSLDKLAANQGSDQNTFYIYGSNAKEIANEVSTILQRKVERRKASWAQ